MSSLTKSKELKLRIIGMTSLALLSLASLFVGTAAWFNTKRAVAVEAGTFQVVTPDDQKAELYYYNGNFNQNSEKYSGYNKIDDLNSISFENSFSKVDESTKTENNPCSTKELWPGYKLTYALQFTPNEDASYGLELLDVEFEDSETKKILEDGKETPISLSWVFEVYGAYAADEETNAKVYLDSTLKHTCQVNKENPLKEKTQIVAKQKKNKSKESILFFTIEFSNDPSTFYQEIESTQETNADSTSTITKWKQNNDSPTQSNCYEGLSITSMVFRLN